MVNELKVGYVYYWKTGSVLLINEFLLFQYSQAIFSGSISALALTLATKCSHAHNLSNVCEIGRQIPAFTELLTHEY